MPVKGGGTSPSKTPRSRRGTASRGGRSPARSSSPKKSKSAGGTKKSSKKRKTGGGRRPRASEKTTEKRPPVDMLDPAVMRNLHYIAHGAPDALSMRGFGWPDAPKGKKKRGGGSKGKKKKK